MGLGSLHKSRRSERRTTDRISFQPQLEALERRDLLAIFLPDTFAGGQAQPVGTAFNGGEQAFFAGFSGNLRFQFGHSAPAAGYTTSPATNHNLPLAGPTPTWNGVAMNSLLAVAADAPVGNLKTYQGWSADGTQQQLHVVYRAAGDKLIDIGSTSSLWQSQEIVASGAVSDPEAASFNGGRQVLYIDGDGRVHFVASADAGASWSDTDLTALVGEDANAAAKAVPTSGVAAIQVGSFEYYMYHRADGALGYFLWNGTAWGYDVLDSTDLPGLIAPFNGATGAMESVSYRTSGAGNPNVGWVLYKDGAGDVRGVWLAEGSTWRTAILTNVRTASAPAAAYDPVARKLSVAYYDANSHLHLLQEGAKWTNTDYHASPILSMPLGNLGETDAPATPASGVMTLASGATITITAASGGTLFNDVTVEVVAGVGVSGTASAAYDSATKVITVSAVGNPTKAVLASAIDALAEFNAVAGGAGLGFDAVIDGFGTFATLSGATDVVPGTPARPDIYFRDFASGNAAPSLQILYKDMSNHVHNVRPTLGNPVVFDTTAYLEGYRSTFGYGLVNAARAVAYALGTQTVTTGAPLQNWNLDLVKAPDAWATATGANAAVFVLDSGVDTNHLDLNTLAGRNVVAQTTNVTDSDGHGTGVAALIAAKNDAGGITGVAFDARVVPVKIGDGSVASEAAIVSGIDYAMNYTLPAGYATATRILNLSLATSQSANVGSILPAVRDKLYAESPDAVFVLAAGNRTQNRPDYPAGFAVGFGIVAGAINIDGKRWAPSNGNNTLAPVNYLLAPGVNVPTAALVGDSGDSYNQANVSGTSAAAAHISGVIALMLDANPALTPREAESILIASADQMITQTVAASAPSIPATIYWAGGSDGGQIAALTTILPISIIAGQEDAAADQQATLLALTHAEHTTPIIAATTSAAVVDEVFDEVAESEELELFDELEQNFAELL